jgi:hypothetical protein
MTDEELEVAIATYRVELIEEGGLAGGDLDELEDHLRALVTELRDAGLSAQIAFVEATRRLGQPHALAREFAHTRPVFGARPSRAAAWSALALMMVSTVPALVAAAIGEAPVTWSVFAVLSVMVMVGLALRTSWARAIVFGNAAYGLVVATAFLFTPTFSATLFVPEALVDAGLVAFLWPSRRSPLSVRGWALAVVGLAASGVSQVQFTIGTPFADAVIAPYLFGIAGILLCARWATPALLAVAGVLVVSIPDLARGADSNPNTALMFVFHLASIAALVTAAVLARRGARGAGSLRALAR